MRVELEQVEEPVELLAGSGLIAALVAASVAEPAVVAVVAVPVVALVVAMVVAGSSWLLNVVKYKLLLFSWV